MASSGITFVAGSVTYIEDLNTVTAFSETWATEVENARMGESTLLLKITYLDGIATEVITARDGQATLSDKLDLLFDETAGLGQNLIGNTYRLTGIGDAVDPQDSTTLSQVNALISGGGSPGDILITSLNVGTMNDGELTGRVGSSIVGVPKSDIDITDFGIGTASDEDIIVVSGTDIIGSAKSDISVTDFGKGTATAGDIYVAGASQVESIPKSNLDVTDIGYGTATDGQYIKRVGSALVGADLTGIGLYDQQVVASNITAETGKLYLIDTSLAERTITLPVSMANGFAFKTVDLDRNFNTTNAHLARNGHDIEGLSEDYDFTLDGEVIEWMYYLTDDNLKRIG